ncbi:MAG: hypothetical protein ABR569_03480 [Gaiellaceae bacterium]
MTPVGERSARRRRRRRAGAVRWAAWIAAGLVVFGAGVALGEALHDNPRPGGTIIRIRTLPPGTIRKP